MIIEHSRTAKKVDYSSTANTLRNEVGTPRDSSQHLDNAPWAKTYCTLELPMTQGIGSIAMVAAHYVKQLPWLRVWRIVTTRVHEVDFSATLH